MEVNKVYQGDSAELMKKLPDNFIDLTVTSPPYDNLRDYNGYKFDFETIAKELFRVTKQGGIVVWIIGDRINNGSETLEPFRQAIKFKECGFNIHDTMIYQKNAMPFPEQTRYIQCFEYMFILSKGKPNTTNLLKEKTRGYKPSKSSAQRNKDGNTTKLKYEQGKALRSKWNVWIYEVGYNKTTKDKIAFEHPAMFPEQLAKDHIISWSNKRDLVFDPFAGSGTTLKMAMLNDRNYLGFEISAEYCALINQRIGSNLSGFIHTSANADPKGHLIGIKRKPCEVSQISDKSETSLNSDIKRNWGCPLQSEKNLNQQNIILTTKSRRLKKW